MGHNRDYRPEDIAFPNQVITESELVGEMEDSYKQYAMSVIVGRALPVQPRSGPLAGGAFRVVQKQHVFSS